MIEPFVATDPMVVWVELYNAHPDDPIVLTGHSLVIATKHATDYPADSTDYVTTVPIGTDEWNDDYVLAPLSYFVLGTNGNWDDNGNVDLNFVFALPHAISTTDASISLVVSSSPTTVLSRVAWSPAHPGSFIPGASKSWSPKDTVWCDSVVRFGNVAHGDFGTPGHANHCRVPLFLTRIVIQSTAAASYAHGTTLELYNADDTYALDLTGYNLTLRTTHPDPTVETDLTRSYVIPTRPDPTYRVPPGGTFLLGATSDRATNGNVAVDWSWNDIIVTMDPQYAQILLVNPHVGQTVVSTSWGPAHGHARLPFQPGRATISTGPFGAHRAEHWCVADIANVCPSVVAPTSPILASPMASPKSAAPVVAAAAPVSAPNAPRSAAPVMTVPVTAAPRNTAPSPTASPYAPIEVPTASRVAPSTLAPKSAAGPVVAVVPTVAAAPHTIRGGGALPTMGPTLVLLPLRPTGVVPMVPMVPVSPTPVSTPTVPTPPVLLLPTVPTTVTVPTSPVDVNTPVAPTPVNPPVAPTPVTNTPVTPSPVNPPVAPTPVTNPPVAPTPVNTPVAPTPVNTPVANTPVRAPVVNLPQPTRPVTRAPVALVVPVASVPTRAPTRARCGWLRRFLRRCRT